jgi:hypothetical protein
MGQFEPDDIETGGLPTNLGTATEDLRTTVESEVTRIVRGAEARAADIEDQALERAARIEAESEQRVGATFEDSRLRVAQMLAEIQVIERIFGEAIQSLRVKADQLTGGIERARTEPFDATEQDPVEEVLDPAIENYAVPSSIVPPEAEVEPEAPTADPEAREMIRQHLQNMAENGRSRVEAERMLMRFKLGEQYLDLLDDLYPPEVSQRKGFLRRRT